MPDGADPLWSSWSLGVVENWQMDPKFANAEEILAPNPGHLVKVKTIVPYQTPMFNFALKQTPKQAIEMIMNSAQITDASTSFVPTAGTPGMEGYIQCQNYDNSDNLILNVIFWCFLKLKSPLKADPKAMTKPEFEAEMLYSVNNSGTI